MAQPSQQVLHSLVLLQSVMVEGQEVGSRRNYGQLWPLKLALVGYMPGRCRHLDCRREAEAHSRALHIRLVDGRRRNCSEVVRIVLVDCGSQAIGDMLEVPILFSSFSVREDSP